MRVSVVIPCYNAGRWIQETLRSVQNQSLSPHEIIVIDDGSTDDSVRHVKNSRVDVKLLQTEHTNAAAARNMGIRIATGDWIAFQDAHDRWFPEHLELAASVLRGGNDVAYAADGLLLHPNGETKPQAYPPPFSRVTTGLTHFEFIDNYGKGYFFVNQSKLILKQRLFEVGLHDVNLPRRHDIDLWLRVIHNHTWCFNPSPTVVVRAPTGTDISANVPMAQFFKLRALLKNYPHYPGSTMENLIRRTARRVISSAFNETTDPDHRRRALMLAWPWLKPSHKLFCLLASRYPSLLRAGIGLRQRYQLALRNHAVTSVVKVQSADSQ